MKARVVLVLFWLLAVGVGARTWEMPVMATWTEDPRTTVTLTWERPEAAVADVAYAAGDEDWQVVSREEPLRRHVVTLRGLEPGTRYRYRAASADGYEAEGAFWTAPDDPRQPFSFALLNDLQGGINVEAAKEVALATAAAGADFVLSTGDIADPRYAGDYAGVIRSWELTFECLGPLWAGSVFQMVSGNHDEPENPDSHWHRLIELPDAHDYTLDVGPIRFILVDSTEEQVPSRIAWLSRELQRAAYDSAVTWVIPAFHRPPFSEGERGGEGIIRKWWVPLFTRYEADLVISGHAHTYQRTRALDGVHYLVSGGGGGRLYEVPKEHPNLHFATSAYHFAHFHVDGDRIVLEGKLTDGSVFDRAEYRARRHVRVEPVFPVRGEPCTVWYDPAGGPLEDSAEIALHLGRDNFQEFFRDVPMERDAETGLWKATFATPETAKWNVAFCFVDPARKVWHNNHKQDWQALVARDW